MKKRFNRLFAGLLAVLLVVSILPVIALAEEQEVIISTLADLQRFAADVNGGQSYEGITVILSTDMSLGGEGNPWTPIGTSTSPFKGTFDGSSHIISGLYIASGSYVGLFGCVQEGTVENLTVKGSVTGTSNAAGIVGYLKSGTVKNCGNQADVSGASAVGGVVGAFNGACTVEGCYNSGVVSGTIGYIGGIVGQGANASLVQDCYNVGTVSGPATVGGIGGSHKAYAVAYTNCYHAGTVIDTAGNGNNIGTVAGVTKGAVTNCYYLKGTGINVNAYGNEVETLDASLLGTAFRTDDDHLNSGYPVLNWQERIPDVIISSYEDLKLFADSVNGGNAYEDQLIRLDVNLFLGGESTSWTPIGTSTSPFKGTFDGNYHVISGLFIASGSNIGFFGYVNGGTVRNLTVQGTVNGSGSAAGIVGYLKSGTVKNCGNQADVSGASAVGGVVGAFNGACTVEGCYNSGVVSGTIGYIGGIVGQGANASLVQDCYNVGTVSGPATVGGIGGSHKAYAVAYTNCYHAGTVIDTAGNGNNIGTVAGVTKGAVTNCYYLKGTGINVNAYGNEVETLDNSLLGAAFAAGDPYPVLFWESSVSTDTPIRPAFVESTELSARLAEYIKAAVNSAKSHSGISGTLLGDADYVAGASSTATDWMALAMGRFGYEDSGENYYLIDDGSGYSDYLAAMKVYIEKTYAENGGILHSAKATEWHRAVVAIAALGGDPTNFGAYNGEPINLIADGSYNCSLKNGPGTQGINGWIWGLIALDVGSYKVPADAKYTRENFITEILKLQLTDGVNGNEYGGWVLGGYGNSSDVDITAMALQALAPYYNDDTVYSYRNENSSVEVSRTVRQCVDDALDRLGAMMNSSGGFTSWNTNNVESISQVVVALCSLGIDPAEDERFITSDGKTLLDGILQFRLSDGGFCHILNGGWNSMANDQATYALVSYWRLENGMRSLYDMRSDWTSEEKSAIDAANEAIVTLPLPAAAEYKMQLKEALAVFRKVPENERRYVSRYDELAAAIELIGGEEALDTDAAYIVSISITKEPDKVRYYEGESFDPAGMVVTALYNDGSTENITGYRISAKDELELATDVVFITYGILKASVAIEVREKMPWSGEGTEEAPYLIETADDLVELYNYVGTKKIQTSGVFFQMTQDINMKNIADWRGIADGASYQNAGFCGHFDGNGYSIWNLNASTYNCNGLFGKLGDGAVIENLTIASGTIVGSYLYSIGGIAGSVVSNASVTIRNCHNYATVSGTGGVGGILGQIEDSAEVLIENCSNHGAISASYTGGGILGQVGPNRWKTNGATATVKNCYNAGEISGSGYWGLGGIVGSYRLGGIDLTNTLSNCYNMGIVNEVPASGAIFGSVTETNVILENVYYLRGTNTKAYGFFDDDGADTVGTVNGNAVSKDELEMKEDSFIILLGTAFEKDTEPMNGGYPILVGQKSIGEEVPVRAGLEIGTVDELLAFAERVNAGENFTNKTVALTAHIDLSQVSEWTPIGKASSCQFDGIFDGQGYVIDNLYSTTGGLFGYVGVHAVIQNVGVASGEIGASNSSFMGGIAKWSNGADFLNCWNGAEIICSGYSGGIVGTVRDGGESLIQNCYNIGTIYASADNVGGIVGHLATSSNGTSVNVTIENCYNAGTITADDCAAGIAGRVQDGHVIRNCYNVGIVTVVGGNLIDGAGGIAGLVTSYNEIIDCYYDSAVTACGVSNGSDMSTGKSIDEMRSEEFLALLGEYFKADMYALENNGCPLLFWQNTENADAIHEVISKIEAIGIVTLEHTDAVTEARNAYDALDDELKSYVSNLDVLEQAEKEVVALQLLQLAKEAAIDQLEAYKKFSDYREEQQRELEQIVTAGINEISAAENADAVSRALADAKEKADAVKTDQQLTNEETSQAVSEQIALIGIVTLDSEESIKAIHAAYDALSEEAKALVSNYADLLKAEETLAALKSVGSEPPVEPPHTGDRADLTLFISLLLISLVTLVMLSRKRKVLK